MTITYTDLYNKTRSERDAERTKRIAAEQRADRLAVELARADQELARERAIQARTNEWIARMEARLAELQEGVDHCYKVDAEIRKMLGMPNA